MITEEERHRLYQRLEAVLGHDEATTLMEHLPPVGWADVATRRDVDHLGETLRNEMKVQRSELEASIARSERRVIFSVLFAVIASNATIAGLAFGAARLG